MADNTQQLAELAQLLLDVTKERALTWSADNFNESAFTAVLGDATVKLSPTESYISVEVHNKEGVAVEQYHAWQRDNPAREVLAEVYDLARRQALRTDEVVASVLGELRRRTIKR